MSYGISKLYVMAPTLQQVNISVWKQYSKWMQGQLNVVEISFVINDSPLDTARYQMDLIDGKWKIVRRVSPDEMPQLGSPSEISTSPPE